MLNSLVVKSILDKKIESGCGSDGYMTKENPTGTGSLSMNRHPTANIGANSTAEGFKCEASGASSHAEGNSTTASGQASHAEGKSTKASGDYSHAEGVNTKASSYYSHAEGFKCEASGYYSHAEGSYTTASASSSHAEGTSCLATAQASHAEGNGTTASERDSHAEGDTTTASGQASHAEGFKTKASGPNSHAEGVNTEASGYYSHAEGLGTKASGSYSHSGGNSTIAGYRSQTAIGEYNDNKEEDIFEVGNGTSNTARSNALELTKTGDLKIGGNYIDGSGNVLSMGSANEYTDQKIADLINGAPTTLDTLKEIADARAENQDVVKALDDSIGAKANSSDLTDHTGDTNNPHNVTAEQTPYDNTESGLSAQNVQDAVDEVSSNLEQLEYSDLAGGKNLFNENTVLIGYGLHAQTGDTTQSANFNCSDYIKVEPNTTYTRSESGSTTTIVYDSSKKYISELGNILTFTIPPNGAYVRFNIVGDYINNYSDIQFIKGTTITQNVPYIMSNKQLTEEINEQNASLDEVNEKVGQNGCGEVAGGKNIANPDNFKDGKVVDFNSGTILDNSRYFVSGYIAVEPSTIYTKQGFSSELENWFYDENKLPIHNISTDTFTSPSNAKYVVLSAPIENKSICMLEKGSTATPYEPYYPSNKMLAENKADKSQVTTNLLKPTLQTETQNGVTCTNNGDGTYTLNGTASNWTSFYLSKIYFENGKKYKMIGCVGGSADTYYLSYSKEPWYICVNENGALIEGKGEEVQILITCKPNSVLNNVLFKPMITIDLNATYDDFVSFTGTTGKLNGDVAELEKSNEGKMDKANPTGTGAFSMNRKADTTVGENSTTEGSDCEASGEASHAEGSRTTASNRQAHAEGSRTTASGIMSHSEGSFTTASNSQAHAEGNRTTASGQMSHSEGYETTASGHYSHSGGNRTVAGYSSQTAIGEYNENKEEDIFEVGNGTSKTARSNALELTRTGDLTLGGDCTFTDANGNKISMRDILTRLAALEPGFSVDVEG